MGHEEVKAFLNATQHSSVYAPVESKGYSNKSSRNNHPNSSVQQVQSSHNNRNLFSSSAAGSVSGHYKQNSVKTPTKMLHGNSNSISHPQNEEKLLSSEKKEDGMKICKGPFNVNCTTCKDPQLVLFEMVKSLEINKVTYKKVSNCLITSIGWFLRVEMPEEQRQI